MGQKKKYIEKQDSLSPGDNVESIPGMDAAGVFTKKSVQEERAHEINKIFLNRFSDKDIWDLIIRSGLSKHLSKKGFSNPCFDFGMDGAIVHYLRIYDKQSSMGNLLMDLRISEERFYAEGFFRDTGGFSGLEMLSIEWLSLENPRADFSQKRPRLPGQKKPGLNALVYILDILDKISRRLSKDGFMDLPDRIHCAIIYSKQLKFFDPLQEGVLRAILRDLRQYTLEDISWGIATKTIIDMTRDKPYSYRPAKQVYPVSQRLENYFNTREYIEAVNIEYQRNSFWLDYKNMLILKEEIINSNYYHH